MGWRDLRPGGRSEEYGAGGGLASTAPHRAVVMKTGRGGG